MTCRPFAACTGALMLSLLASAAQAQSLTLKVNALTNCYETTEFYKGNGATHVAAVRDLPRGTYTVKVKSSTTDFCGGTGGGCPQPGVSLNISSSDQEMAPYVVKPGHKITLNLLNGGTAVAYVMDAACHDNTGTTVLEFVPVPPPALE